jgi:hypothetical protein
MLERVKGMGWKGVEWIHLVQDKDQWQVLKSILMNIRVSEKVGNTFIRISWVTISFSRRICFMVLIYVILFIEMILIIGLHAEGREEVER